LTSCFLARKSAAYIVFNGQFKVNGHLVMQIAIESFFLEESANPSRRPAQ
jgi:hypothetical protein